MRWNVFIAVYEKFICFSGSTVAAQVAAIQRFSTPLGWKQMGSWLKTAEANEDWSRLKLLLSQCAQASCFASFVIVIYFIVGFYSCFNLDMELNFSSVVAF